MRQTKSKGQNIMDQKDQIPTVESIQTEAWQVPTDRIILKGLRLKKGTALSVGLNKEQYHRPEIRFYRGSERQNISFETHLNLNGIPPIMVSANAINGAIDKFGIGAFADPLLISIFAVVGTVTLEFLFDDDGWETNTVRISLIAGKYAVSTNCKLAVIIEYIGETGIMPIAE
jgi:hypothetical protein